MSQNGFSFTFKKKIGETEFTFQGNAETHKDFFEQSSFFTSLPTTAPGGATDLELVARSAKTKDGKPCKYYSIISKSEGLEFDLGQSMQTPGELFGKGWKPAFKSEAKQQSNASGYTSESVPQSAPSQQENSTQQTATAPQSSTGNQAINDVLSKYGLSN